MQHYTLIIIIMINEIKNKYSTVQYSKCMSWLSTTVACKGITVWAWILHSTSMRTFHTHRSTYPFSFCSLHRVYSPIIGKCIQQTISECSRVPEEFFHHRHTLCASAFSFISRWRDSTANELTLKNKQFKIGLRFVFLVSWSVQSVTTLVTSPYIAFI